MKSLITAIGLTAATALTPFSAAFAEAPPPPAAMHERGGPPKGEFGHRFQEHRFQEMARRAQTMMAERLATAETQIGIRSAQLDTWRDFTTAALAFASPPDMPRGPGNGPHGGPPAAPGAGPEGGPGMGFGMGPGAGDRLQRLAAFAADRAAKADALAKAATALDEVLTPEQKQIVAEIDLMAPPHRPGHKPPHPRDGDGPRGFHRDGPGMGPAGMGPADAPSPGPEAAPPPPPEDDAG